MMRNIQINHTIRYHFRTSCICTDYLCPIITQQNTVLEEVHQLNCVVLQSLYSDFSKAAVELVSTFSSNVVGVTLNTGTNT